MIADLLRRSTFPPPGTPVICALSGGADSTALVGLAVAAGCESPRSTSTTGSARVGGRRRVRRGDGRGSASPFRLGTRRRSPTDRTSRRARASPASRARPRRPDRAHRRRPGRDDVVNLLRGRRARRAQRRWRPAPTKPILALRRAETVRSVRGRGPPYVRRPDQRRPPVPSATGSATRSCRCWPTSPARRRRRARPHRRPARATTTTCSSSWRPTSTRPTPGAAGGAAPARPPRRPAVARPPRRLPARRGRRSTRVLDGRRRRAAGVRARRRHGGSNEHRQRLLVNQSDPAG